MPHYQCARCEISFSGSSQYPCPLETVTAHYNTFRFKGVWTCNGNGCKRADGMASKAQTANTASLAHALTTSE